MDKIGFLKELETVSKIAAASKFYRLLLHPFKYFNAILFRELIYKRKKQSKAVTAKTFFGTSMNILLPSSTDIYLTGGKSHDSEIRLAKFIIKQLRQGDGFVDVGAHYGYFSLLASKIVGTEGKVLAFEASPSTFRVLQKNIADWKNITAFNKAVSDSPSSLTFYEFPALYSEYNTMDISQFEGEDWFSEFQPKAIEVEAVVLGDVIKNQLVVPKIIKIDVEGAEFKVINGLKEFLKKQSPAIVMEYLSDERGNRPHKEAEKLLKGLKYKAYTITDSADLESIENISNYLNDKKMESDNIVFVR
ncbi:MAG: FkbM family methyltransferase [Chitinophagales bacterium]